MTRRDSKRKTNSIMNAMNAPRDPCKIKPVLKVPTFRLDESDDSINDIDKVFGEIHEDDSKEIYEEYDDFKIDEIDKDI